MYVYFGWSLSIVDGLRSLFYFKGCEKMFILLFAFWILLNGKINLEITIIGLIICGLVYAFACFFLQFSFKKDMLYCKNLGKIAFYFLMLISFFIPFYISQHVILSANAIASPGLKLPQRLLKQFALAAPNAKRNASNTSVLQSNSLTHTALAVSPQPMGFTTFSNTGS